MEPRRSTRKAVTKKNKIPDASYYMGYIEDEVTPEMIMEKFHELEKLRQSEAPNQTPVGEEDESQMQKVLEAAGAFNLREVFRTDAINESDLSGVSSGHQSDDDFVLSEGEESDGFWDDYLEDNLISNNSKLAKKYSKKKPPRPNGTVVSETDNKRPGVDGVIRIKLPPPPLAPSLGRIVQPYSSKAAGDTASGSVSTSVKVELPANSLDLSAFYRKFIGVMINLGWTTKPSPLLTLQSLSLSDLCPDGFIFIWIPKAFIQPVWKILRVSGFKYVESLTWIQLKANNKVQSIHPEDPSILPRSHIVLYIFKKGGRDIEIRHQRSSDVVLDVFRDNLTVPKEVYEAIETMLPTSKGKLLEIWSANEADRSGWTHIYEI